MKSEFRFTLMLVFAMIVLQVSVYGQPSPQRQFTWKSPPDRADDNLKDRRPLKDKAKNNGRYVATEYPPTLTRFNTLDALARSADAIVIAKAIDNASRISSDGMTVTTDYQLKVEHGYKGKLAEGGSISVSLPGGLTRFSDGSSAEIRTPWFRKMVNGRTYLLFLNRRGNRWSVTGGPRGLFEIPTTEGYRNVTSHSLMENDPMRAYNDTEVIQFLRAVKQSAKRAR
jgi:hypothetical protein